MQPCNYRVPLAGTFLTLVAGLLLPGLALLRTGIAQADTTYKAQAIVREGDPIGDPPLKVDSWLSVSGLNDNGQIVFDTAYSTTQSVVQYADGKFTLIMVAGRDAPGGKWPNPDGVYEPLGMNQRGNVVFGAQVRIGTKLTWGTFLWDAQTQTVKALALDGMPAVNNLTFKQAAGWAPAINASDEVALVAKVSNAAGVSRDGIFLFGRDGKLLPVALPDQELSGGARIARAWLPSLTDTGVIAFLARRVGDTGDSAYLWEQGTITPLLAIDADVPGGGKLLTIRGIWLNNKSRSALVYARVQVAPDPVNALYLLADGKLTRVAVSGQEMIGGGKFRELQTAVGEGSPTGVSLANAAGQHAFLAHLEDGATAAYLMDADGRLSLILKSGTTEFGTVERVGAKRPATLQFSNGIGLNSKGQVAFSVHLANDTARGIEALLLLTPVTP